MTKKYTTISIVFILILLLIIQISLFWRDKAQKSFNEQSFHSLLLENDSLECHKYNGIIFADTNKIIINHKNDSLTIGDIIKNNPLILRYSNWSCNPCVENILSHLEKYKHQNSNRDIIILISDIYYKDLFIITKRYNNKFSFYRSDSLCTDFDQALTPYMYSIDQNKKINNFYIPRIEFPQRNTEYFESISLH